MRLSNLVRPFFFLVLLALIAGAEPNPGEFTLKRRTFHLDAYLWINSMPGPEPRNRGLMATVNLKPASERDEPLTVAWESLSVLQDGKLVWNTPLKNEEQRGSARGGPALEPGSTVTVQARFCDPSGKLRMLETTTQIEQVW